MALAIVKPIRPAGAARQVLEFDCGVRAYEPASPGGLWRLRWGEGGRARDTTAASREAAVAKAEALVGRLGRGRPTDLGRATGAELVAHYLDPARRPPRTERWSARHRGEQERYCALYVAPAIGALRCRSLTAADLQRALDAAPTASVAKHLRACLTGVANAGLEAGHLLAGQDVLRGLRWQPPAGHELPDDPGPARAPRLASDGLPDDPEDGWGWGDGGCRAVAPAEIPTTEAVHALAAAAAGLRGVWWRELEVLLVAYSGLRWGGHVALRAHRVDAAAGAVSVERQVVEAPGGMQVALPKGRRVRTTVFPATTPGGADLAAMVRRRLAEVGPDGLLFPSPRGRWARRSNYGRNTWDPAAGAAGWPRRADGRWAWTFHSLRHVFASWAIAIGTPLEDVSGFMGHSSTRVTQEVYVHVFGDAAARFHAAAG